MRVKLCDSGVRQGELLQDEQVDMDRLYSCCVWECCDGTASRTARVSVFVSCCVDRVFGIRLDTLNSEYLVVLGPSLHRNRRSCTMFHISRLSTRIR